MSHAGSANNLVAPFTSHRRDRGGSTDLVEFVAVVLVEGHLVAAAVGRLLVGLHKDYVQVEGHLGHHQDEADRYPQVLAVAVGVVDNFHTATA